MFFNANEVEKVELGRLVFDAGAYPAVIENAEMRTSQRGAEYLSLRLRCFKSLEDGTSVSVFSNLNIYNHNETAKSMARTLLAKICEGVGRPQLQGASDLIGGKFTATLSKQKDSNGQWKNELKNASKLAVDFDPQFLAAKKVQAATGNLSSIPIASQPLANGAVHVDNIPF